MRLAVLKEGFAQETRVAATPDSVRKLIAMGLEVVVEHEHSATTTEDGNEMLRDAEASYCMRTKGYTLQSAR